MVEVTCPECGQPWAVNTPPALPLYPHGLIAHYCPGRFGVAGAGSRVVRPPKTVAELALVGSSVTASRLAAFPRAAGYVGILMCVARVELESELGVGLSQLRELQLLWRGLTDDEREVVKGELLAFRVVAGLVDDGVAALVDDAANCPSGQLDNLNAVTPTDREVADDQAG